MKFKHIFTIRIGNTKHVVLGAPGDGKHMEKVKADLMKKARAAMLRGEDIEFDGCRQWIQDIEHYPTVWHADGNRTLHDRVRFSRLGSTPVRMVEKTFYRKPELI